MRKWQLPEKRRKVEYYEKNRHEKRYNNDSGFGIGSLAERMCGAFL